MSPRARDAGSTFDAAASDYEAALSVNSGAARRLVASLPGGRGGALLDVGCGTGYASRAAVELLGVTHVVGIDPSPQMLHRFDATLAGLGVSPRVIEAQAEAVPLEPESVDLALSTMVLQWVEDRHAALGEIARVLRPGGLLGVIVPARGADREFHEVLRRLDPPVPPAWRSVEASRTLTPSALRGDLRAAGFEVLDEWVEERTRLVAPDELIGRMKMVGDHVFPVPPEDPELWSRVRGGIARRATPAGFGHTFRKLFAVARREHSRLSR